MGWLYERSLYTKDVNWVVHEIFEYDITKANISMLLQYGYITPNEFKMYSEMPKLQRQIAIGRLQKIQTYNNAIQKGLEHARKELFTLNNIKDEETISIKKDAVYVIRRLNVTDFGNIHFTLRGRYSIFMNIMGLEIYFYYDEVNDTYDIEVKGINDSVLYKHEPFMSILCNALKKVQQGNVQAAIQYIMDIRTKYVSKELPTEYYREFHRGSWYSLANCSYYADELTEEEKVSLKKYISTIYNDTFLTKFLSFLIEMEFTR